jgi:hypothetical protein
MKAMGLNEWLWLKGLVFGLFGLEEIQKNEVNK